MCSTNLSDVFGYGSILQVLVSGDWVVVRGEVVSLEKKVSISLGLGTIFLFVMNCTHIYSHFHLLESFS